MARQDTLPTDMTNKTAQGMTFDALVRLIQETHVHLQGQADRAINVGLTLRNWLIGLYIVEYERRGSDRSRYGEGLMQALAERLEAARLSNCSKRELYRYVTFYRVYPEIVETLSPQFKHLLPERIEAVGMPASPASSVTGGAGEKQHQESAPKVGTPSPLSLPHARDLINALSYSHFAELMEIRDPLKRTFYELECIRGPWSVRELRRQISSLYFERSGLSQSPQKLSELVQAGAEAASPAFTLRDPFVFEFLGLKSHEVVEESTLENALLAKLEDFLLELGRGFCFEARQKRIRIGDEYYFVDLVFYHRILKCHILLELKMDEFRHEHLGQLNTYVTWYKRHEMTEGDHPPIGLLLCTRRNYALVEYALAGMDNQLFVNRYQLELPSREDVQLFIERQLREHETE